MELFEYVRVLRQRWWLILLTVLLGMGAALIYVNQTPPTYRSTATLLLSPGLTPDLLTADQRQIERVSLLAENYSYYVKTLPFAQQVVAQEELSVSPRQLVDAISTRRVGSTEFFEITAVADTPQQAQRIAAAVADNFVDAVSTLQREQLSARRSTGDLDDLEQLLRDKLEREQAYYEDRVETLRSELAAAQAMPVSAARLERIDAVQIRLSEYETRLLQILQELLALRPTVAVEQIDTVSIVQPAPLPAAPADEWLQFLLAAFSAALVAGVALAITLEYLDLSIKSPQDVEALLAHPPLGVLERMNTRDGLVTMTTPRQPQRRILPRHPHQAAAQHHPPAPAQPGGYQRRTGGGQEHGGGQSRRRPGPKRPACAVGGRQSAPSPDP